MRKTFRYRIYPSKRQEETLNQTFALCCELYNAALQERRDAWKIERKSISRFDQINQISAIRKDRPDVANVNSRILQDVLARVDKAFKGFFRRVKTGSTAGFPRFRSVRRYDSITLCEGGAPSPVGNRIRLSKIGNVRINLHRSVEGTIKTLTVKREAGRWYAMFACEVEPQPLTFSPNTIGIDVGLTHFATLSDGTQIDNPRYYREGQKALRVAQRRVARRKKGSHRRRKAVKILQRASIAIRNQRADFHHKLSRQLVSSNGLIAAENLNIKGMVRSNLAKSINDAGWAQFLNFIAYKAASAGRVFVQVNPRGTSQTCTCGAEVRKTLSQRWHSCLICGLSLPRDHVSAQVILSRAEAQPSGVNVGLPCVA